MELILWRHAEAEDGISDLARKLTPKGLKQARQMAAWLNPRLPDDIHIMASPAIRTQQTAAALGRNFTTLEALSPGAAPTEVLAAAGWPQGAHSVLVIGHQPTLGAVAALLLAGQDTSWSMKKGAVWWLGNRDRSGFGECVLRAALTPDLL